MDRMKRRASRQVVIAFGIVTIFVGGIVIAALWLGKVAGETWAGIVTETAKSTSPEDRRLPAGSVVLLDGKIVGHLENVRTYGSDGAASSRMSLYTGRLAAQDTAPFAHDSTYVAELVSGDASGVPVVLNLVTHPTSTRRRGELRLRPDKQTIPVY